MSAQPNVVTLQQAAPMARWICLDIETGDAPASAVEAAIAAWKAPSNWKPETVEAKRAEHAEKAREKAALLDASPILCIGLRSDMTGVMFSGMGLLSDRLDLPGWAVADFGEERSMLEAVRMWLDACTDDATHLVGHNVRDFDLPKIRNAYVRHRLQLPRCLRPRMDGPGQPVCDTMALFRHFSMEHRNDQFTGLDVACQAFGIARPKQIVSGSDVPRMHRAGQAAEILTYCCIDVDATAELYRLMTA